MKREEIRTRQQGDTPFYPNMLNNGTVKVCLKEDVDRLLDEKDAEIAALKKKLMPCLNGDCILTCDTVEKYGKENAALKAKLEDVQESAYADSVDAGMRERRLRRALWLARSYRAWCEIDYWRKCLEHADDYFDVRTGQDLEAKRCERMISKWIDVKSKCLKKAEEYK